MPLRFSLNLLLYFFMFVSVHREKRLDSTTTIITVAYYNLILILKQNNYTVKNPRIIVRFDVYILQKLNKYILYDLLLFSITSIVQTLLFF